MKFTGFPVSLQRFAAMENSEGGWYAAKAAYRAPLTTGAVPSGQIKISEIN